ncbi:hypothetical protein MHBO_001144, partial [Bonamia ostreae]
MQMSKMGDLLKTVVGNFLDRFNRSKIDKVKDLERLIDKENTEKIDQIRIEIENYADSLKQRKSEFDIFLVPLQNKIKTVEAKQSSLDSLESNRYGKVEKIHRLRLNLRELQKEREMLQEKAETKLEKLRTEFNRENGDILAALQKFLEHKHKVNTEILGDFFDDLKKKLGLLGDLLQSRTKKVKSEFTAARDVSELSMKMSGEAGSMGFYFHENLMESDILESTRTILQKSRDLGEKLISFTSQFGSAHKCFKKDVSYCFAAQSVLSKNLGNLISAINDFYEYRSFVIETETKKFEYFIEKLGDYAESLQNYTAKNGEALEKIDPKDIKTKKSSTGLGAGFDENFFAALEESKSTFNADVENFK